VAVWREADPARTVDDREDVYEETQGLIAVFPTLLKRETAAGLRTA
jgi:hypothetical protein